MLKTKKLLKECGYKKVIIDDSNKMILEHPNGKIFHVVDNDHHNSNDDIDEEDDDDFFKTDDDNYCYNFNDDDDDDNDDDSKKEHEDEEENEENEEETEEEIEEERPQRRRQQRRQQIQYKDDNDDGDDIMDEDENDDGDDIMDEDENEESEEEDRSIRSIPEFTINMGRDLYKLLQNIHKIPTPPPTTNNYNLDKEKYRTVLVNHLSTINSVNDFLLNNSVFVPVNSSRKSSLSFILNEDDDEEKEEEEIGKDDREMPDVYYDVHQINIDPNDPIINRNVITDLNDPSSLLTLPLEEFENKKQAACTIITNIIIRIYDLSLKDQISNEIIRRRQFRHLVLLYDYYEKLEVYCNLYKERERGQTIKSQAIKMIVKSSKSSSQEAPRIKNSTISTILNKASRIKRLLGMASNNFNIIDGFPDLEPYMFSAKRLSVINFERWLELIRTNNLVSFKEGEQLYKDFKAETKRKRNEKLNRIYNK